MAVLLDTSVASLVHRGGRTSILRNQYERHMAGQDLWISFQTAAELWMLPERNNWGTAKRAALEAFLSRFTVLPYDEGLGRTWARVMDEAIRRGRRLESADAWIVATAVEYAVPLLAHDRDLSGLNITGLQVICYA